VKSMPRITVLPEHVANKIAAGEVVERPASVVKELVENSIDAGAKEIAVLLTAGGKRSISVTDDGYGMTRDDAILAFERHATSKVRYEADLDRIGTLGFRGEALPSIAAVSRLTLVTRTVDSLAGTRVVLRGGVVKNVSEVGAPPGTRVTANSLYFNTPARAKFLKSTATELSHGVEIVQRHALAHPDISFRLTHNGKQLFDLPAVGSLADRAALIWGPKFAREMVEVAAERNGVNVSGLIGRPTLYRAQKNMQMFFLNRRPVVSRALARAAAEAYRGLLPTGKFPVAILFAEIDPAEADVNVHPAKREVKFRREREVYSAVISAIKSALESEIPRTVPVSSRPQTPAVAPSKERSQEVVEAERAPDVRQDMEPGVQRQVEREAPQAEVRAEEKPVERRPPGLERRPERTASAEPETETSALTVSPLFSPGSAPFDVPLQVFGTYLVAPQEDRLLIIDQHALHERITYEKLKRELGQKQFSMQRLLVPINMELSPAQAKLIGEHLPLLESIGVQLENFGENTFIITAICHIFSEQKVEELIRHVVAELEQGDLLEDERKLRERLLVLTVSACRSSIKAGEPLTAEQRTELLAGLHELSPPYTCPHGRPIMTELTLEQLERGFRRR